MRRHAARHGGPIHLAWVLMAGINTGADEARGARPAVRGRAACGSRVIDVNDPTRPLPARRTTPSAGGSSPRWPTAGIGFVRRYSGGPDIHAACGMLASSATGGVVI